MYLLPQETKGSSVLEVIMALAIFSLIAASLISVATGSFGGLLQGGDQTQADSLAQEGIEAVRSINAETWNRLTFGTSSVSVYGNEWVFDGEDSIETIGKYTRNISFSDVCRDSGDNIVDCPGDYTDLYTKKVLVTVSWNPRVSVTNVVTKSAYITNWESRELIQTDWRGGDGQSVWLNEDEYASSTEIDTSTTGEIQLATASGGSWENAGGVLVTDTTVADFTAGTHASTTIIGFGVMGSVTLLEAGAEYEPEGIFISDVIDSGGSNADWGSISWTEVLSVDSDITFSFRSGDTDTPDGSWSAWSSEVTNATSSAIVSPSSRYIQYRATLTLGSDPAQSPQLDDVQIIFNAPTAEHLFGISAVSDSNIWVSADNGRMLHYNGSTWSETTVSPGESLNDVFMFSVNEGYAVGASGKILDYNGSSWSEDADTGTETWNAISMVSTSSVFAVGNKSVSDGVVASFDGTSWSVSNILGLDANLYGVDAVSASDVWAVGDLGKVVHYNGLAWSEFADLGDDAIRDIHMRTSSNGWAVGDNGKIYHYDGSTWSEHTDTGAHTWNAVEMRTSSQGWVVGNNGAMYEWDGSVWNEMAAVVGQDLYNIAVISSSDIWAVGAYGSIIHFSRGADYQSAGSLISSAYDMGAVKAVQGIEWDAVIPACNPECDIALQLSAAPDDTGSPGVWTDWYGVGGIGGYYTNATGTLVSADLSEYQWIRYRAILTGDGDDTPVLEEVRINHK